jgi:hypothetical protein
MDLLQAQNASPVMDTGSCGVCRPSGDDTRDRSLYEADWNSVYPSRPPR